MLGAVLASLLVFADAGDDAFLLKRVRDLSALYEEYARQQSGTANRQRAGVVREIRHLPFSGTSRKEAGKLLARVVAEDRSYRIRADAARAIGRVGTAPALDALYRSLFREKNRSRRYALLYAVLPEALAGLRHPDDLEWISERILTPARTSQWSRVLREAGPLREEAIVLTLEGVGRARARALAPETLALTDSPSGRIREAAVRTVVQLDVWQASLNRRLRDPVDEVRAAAAEYRRHPLPVTRRMLADRSALVRRAAIRGVAGREPRGAVDPLLERLLAETNSALRMEVAEALAKVTGKDFGTDSTLWGGWWAANRATFTKPGEREKGRRAYFFDVGLRTRKVVFLIDVSASMSREDGRNISRLEYAARELQATVEKLPNSGRFVVYAYASSLKRFPDRVDRSGDRRTAVEVARWLRKIKPGGATNTYGALMESMIDSFKPDTIVLLSDGNPYRCSFQGKTYSEHEQILAEMRRVNAKRQIRIHTVALLNGGSASDEDAASAAEFLRRLAEQNRGDFREIR